MIFHHTLEMRVLEELCLSFNPIDELAGLPSLLRSISQLGDCLSFQKLQLAGIFQSKKELNHGFVFLDRLSTLKSSVSLSNCYFVYLFLDTGSNIWISRVIQFQMNMH
jgi:hypothetical protein